MDALSRLNLEKCPPAVIAAAKELMPLAERFSAQHDQTGEIAPEVAAVFRDRELFWMQVSLDNGGLGWSPLDTLALVEAVSYADASAGWVMMASSFGTSSSSAYLGAEAVDELFGDGRKAIICGHGAPNGRAVAVEGGYRLSGQWSYGSGIRHATHVLAGAIVYDGDVPRRNEQGMPEILQLVVTRAAATLGGNWDVLGLRATGSLDFTIDEVFVPHSYSFSPEARSTRGGAAFILGSACVASLGHSAVALGAGRHVLDELAAYARSKKGFGAPLSDGEFLGAFARHEARMRAARALNIEVWREVEESLAQHGKASTRQETLIRLALIEATEAAAEAAYFAYRAAGGTSLRAGTLQRIVRDIHGVSQHLLVSKPHFRECGLEIAMDDPSAYWSGITVVKGTGKR